MEVRENMEQPTRSEITEKLQGIIYGTYSREIVGEWAFKYISNDDTIEIAETTAWDYLVVASYVAEMLSPTEYLYSDNDIKAWIEEYK